MGFHNLVEFNDLYSTEEICRKKLSQLRWNDNPVCPHCHNIKVYEYKDGKLYRCAKCRRQFSIKVGTIFEDSRIPLKKWFTAIYLVTSNKNGTSSIQLSRNIGVTQKTAWFMLHKIRQEFQIKSNSILDGTQKKNLQEPMMKQIAKPFDTVLKSLIKNNSTEIQGLKGIVESKTSQQQKLCLHGYAR